MVSPAGSGAAAGCDVRVAGSRTGVGEGGGATGATAVGEGVGRGVTGATAVVGGVGAATGATAVGEGVGGATGATAEGNGDGRGATAVGLGVGSPPGTPESVGGDATSGSSELSSCAPAPGADGSHPAASSATAVIKAAMTARQLRQVSIPVPAKKPTTERPHLDTVGPSDTHRKTSTT